MAGEGYFEAADGETPGLGLRWTKRELSGKLWVIVGDYGEGGGEVGGNEGEGQHE